MEKAEYPVRTIFKVAVLQEVCTIAQVQTQVRSKRNLVIAKQITKLDLCDTICALSRRKATPGVNQVGRKLEAIILGDIPTIIGLVALYIKLGGIEVFCFKSSVLLNG